MHAGKGVTALLFFTSALDECERLTSRSGRLSLGENVPVINLLEVIWASQPVVLKKGKSHDIEQRFLGCPIRSLRHNTH